MRSLTKGHPNPWPTERFDNLLDALGWTQGKLAENLGVSRASVNRWRMNRNIPSVYWQRELRRLEENAR